MDTEHVQVATEVADPSLAAVDQTPESQGTPETQQADPFAEERSRYETQLQEANAERQRALDAQARTDRILAEQAAKAWRDEEVKVREYAKSQDPEQALQTMQSFYQAREQALIGHAQTIQQQAHHERLNAYVDYVARETGLGDAEKTQLLLVGQRDPNAIPAEAERLKANKETGSAELRALRAELEQLKRGQQANVMRQTGAWSAGGGNPQPVSTDVVKGSPEHLRSLLSGTAGFTD